MAVTELRRIECFEKNGGRCHLCGEPIYPLKEKWEAEHIIPKALRGSDEWPNLRPVHSACHAIKTKTDVKEISKAVRTRAKHIGAETPKPPIPSRGFPKREKKPRIAKVPLPRRNIYTTGPDDPCHGPEDTTCPSCGLGTEFVAND